MTAAEVGIIVQCHQAERRCGLSLSRSSVDMHATDALHKRSPSLLFLSLYGMEKDARRDVENSAALAEARVPKSIYSE